jgi:hypothetical protein
VFIPGTSGLPQLDALGLLYESYRLLKGVTVEYRSAAGSVNNGSFIMGVDYDGADLQTGYAAAAAMVPKAIGPITQNSQLRVDHNRAMNKKWLFSDNGSSPGEAAFAITHSNTADPSLGSPGDIWCEYSVEFISPKISTTTFDSATAGIAADGVSATPSTSSSSGNPSYDLIVGAASTGTTTNVDATASVQGELTPGARYKLSLSTASGTPNTINPTPSALGTFWNIVSTLEEGAQSVTHIVEYYGPKIVSGLELVMQFGIVKAVGDAVAVTSSFVKTLQKTLGANSVVYTAQTNRRFVRRQFPNNVLMAVPSKPCVCPPGQEGCEECRLAGMQA